MNRTNKFVKMIEAINEYLEKRGPPAPVTCSPSFRSWYDTVALPLLRDSALSELRRTDQIKPRLCGYFEDGRMQAVDILPMLPNGQFGDQHSKDMTAAVQRKLSMIPGTKASVFVSEVWTLSTEIEPGDDEEFRHKDISKHPDREEAVMLNTIHYDNFKHEWMQLITTIPILKVFARQRTMQTIRGTKLGEAKVIDPLDMEYSRMRGRFVVGDDQT